MVGQMDEQSLTGSNKYKWHRRKGKMNIKQSMLNKSNHMWLYSQQNAPLNFFQNYENTTNSYKKFLHVDFNGEWHKTK